MAVDPRLRGCWQDARYIMIEIDGPVILTSPFYLMRAMNQAQNFFQLPQVDKAIAVLLYYGWQARDWYLYNRFCWPTASQDAWWDRVRLYEKETVWHAARQPVAKFAQLWPQLQQKLPVSFISFADVHTARRQLSLLPKRGTLYNASYRTSNYKKLLIKAGKTAKVKAHNMLVIAQSYDLAHEAFRLKIPVVFYSKTAETAGAATFSTARLRGWYELAEVLQL